MSHELSKQELRKPDEFVGFFESKIHQFENRKKQIFWAVLLILTTLAAFFFFQFQHSKLDQSAAVDFSALMEKLPLGLSASKEETQKFLSEVDVFLKNHSKSSFVPSVNLYKAKAQFSQKQYSEALATYQMASGKFKAPYLYLAQEGEAITHMQMEHWDQAKTILTTLSAKEDNPLRDYHLYNLALVQEQMGDKSAALATYSKIVELFPASEYAEKAKLKNAPPVKK